MMMIILWMTIYDDHDCDNGHKDHKDQCIIFFIKTSNEVGHEGRKMMVIDDAISDYDEKNDNDARNDDDDDDDVT